MLWIKITLDPIFEQENNQISILSIYDINVLEGRRYIVIAEQTQRTTTR